MAKRNLKSIRVDRDQERTKFASMIQGATREHIMLIEAASGMGKSSLLEEFWLQASGLQRARVNLKDIVYTIEDILVELCTMLEPVQFDKFRQCQLSIQADIYTSYEIGIDRLKRSLAIKPEHYQEFLIYEQRLRENIDASRRYGDTDTLRALRTQIIEQLNELASSALSISFNELLRSTTPSLGQSLSNRIPFNISDTGQPSVDQRKQYYRKLTEAFFDDLMASRTSNQSPVVLLFDTFEKADSEVDEWLKARFLNRVRSRRSHCWITVVIAGQRVPELDIDWEEVCVQHTLLPLNRDHVREYSQQAQLPLPLTEEQIELLHRLTKGHPFTLLNLVSNLQEHGDGANE